MDEGNEGTRVLHMQSVLLGAYPYVLIQFEPHNGTWRIGVDFDLLTPDEVIETLLMVLDDLTSEEWI